MNEQVTPIITGPRNGEQANWPLDSQERLAALLIRAYPFGEESEGEIDIERGNDLRIFRDAVIGALLQDPSVEHLARWIDWRI